MPTINSRKLVDTLIANKGRYEDDPLVIKIVEYTNAWGGICYGLIYTGMADDSYAPSAYVNNPRVIWERK